MYQIPVYAAEREAGLEHLIRSTARIAHCSPCYTEGPGVDRPLPPLIRAHASAGGQIDLHYLKSVLVTAGVWNKNDDVMVVAEVWAARDTPSDKPLNYEHKGDDIIGHLTGCYAVDAEGNELAPATAAADLPAKFHLVTPAVLYKVWADEALQARMDLIIAEIAEGKWSVSMEALFPTFDYALRDSKGAVKVVARKEETAFLTKHLRAYKGTGSYGDYRVGRLLRRMTFSGKGLVRNPANPDSVILADDSEPFAAHAAVIGREELLGYENPTEHKTSEESIVMTPEQIAALQAELARATARIKELDAALAEVSTKELSAKAGTLQTEVEAKAGRIAQLEAEAQLKSTAHAELEARLTAVAAELAAANEQLAVAAAAAKKADRIATLAKDLELDQAKAEAMAGQLEPLGDEVFAAWVKAQADYLSEKKAAYQGSSQAGGGADPAAKPNGPANPPTAIKEVPLQTGKPAPMAGMPRKVGTVAGPTSGNQQTKAADDAQADAAAAALENATPVPAAALASENAGAGVERVRASIHDFVTASLGRGKTPKK